MGRLWLQPMAIAILISGSIWAIAIITMANTTADTTSVEADIKSGLSDRVKPLIPEVAADLRNVWPADLETEFWRRAERAIAHYANQPYGNTVGENEKRSYAYAMLDFLAGNQDSALSFLQQEDDEASIHAHTQGIDYYYSFTLKGQIRKYFFLGPFLNPHYRQRMRAGAAAWTERDPLHRPHPIYGNGRGGNGWGPQVRGGWVDSRNTDNLRAMREVSVYLMAEETQNEAVRQIYKQRLQRYVSALYHIGMGEWDSETYHEHTIAAYLNLYDFAQDPEVKAMAKAALDWMFAAGAVKYYQGGFGGPSKRDYGKGNVVFGSPTARFLWLYFGDAAVPNPQPQRDSIHAITSAYRPPLAVVAIAQKAFERPLELLSSKPHYENWKPGKADSPAYWETTFWGYTYQMGSVVSRFPDGDLSPFKLMANHSERGVDYVVINTGEQWQRTGKHPGDQIGHYRNLLIWLNNTDRNFFFQIPETANIEVQDGIWFIQLQQTWLALRPINLESHGDVEFPAGELANIYEAERLLRARPAAEGMSGFAMEVGEAQTHGSYERFQQAVMQRGELEIRSHAWNSPSPRLQSPSSPFTQTVHLRSSSDTTLTLTYNLDHHLPVLRRNGQAHRWDDHLDLYYSPDGGSPIALGWKSGTLRLSAGGHTFESTIASFHEEP